MRKRNINNLENDYVFFTKRMKIDFSNSEKVTIWNGHNSCFYSAFLFIVNIFAGIYYQEYIYTSLFSYLLSTSIYYHSFYSNLGYLFDQTGCISVVIYTFYIFLENIEHLHIKYYLLLGVTYILCLSYILISYFYGARIKMFSHHPNKKIGNYYHSFLHFVSSVGCYAILVLQSHINDKYIPI